MSLPPAYSPSDKDAMSDGDTRHLETATSNVKNTFDGVQIIWDKQREIFERHPQLEIPNCDGFYMFFFVLSIASDDSYRVWGGAVGLVTLFGSNLWRHFTPRTWDTWDTVPEKVRLKKFQLTLAAIFYAMERDFKL
jgi:hypothetical protein